MKRFQLSVATVMCLGLTLATVTTFSLAGPAVGAPIVSPDTMFAGQQTPLTVTSRVSGGATGVTLLRVDESNQVLSTLGAMRNDGAGGDAVAGDNVYTLRFTALESNPGAIRLQVSAGFRGGREGRTSLSEVTSVPVIPGNRAPTADAGPAQTLAAGRTVQLDGSASGDPDGNTLTFSWTFASRPDGSAATLSDTTAVQPTFLIDRPGSYVVRLVVNDGAVDSAPDTVTITTQNSAPVANAGADQTVVVGEMAQLGGGGSNDADGDPLTYGWSLTTKPEGSAASLSNPAAVNPTFVADLPGMYVAQLIVNDGQADSAPDAVTVTTLNTTPVANAGADQTAAVGATVQLDGSGSTDVDGDELTFRWSFTSRPTDSTAALSDPGAVNPAFDADRPGMYVAQLIVNDGQVDSAPDTVVINTVNSPPTADAGPDQTAAVGGTVQLDGGASGDPDGDQLTHNWSFVSRPEGSTAMLSDPSAVNPTFGVDRPGTYVVQLVVNDGFVNSAPATVMVSTSNSPPAAEAGPNQAPYVNNVVRLDGRASNDPDNDTLTFSWSITTKPEGSAATLSDPSSPTPSFFADRTGAYVAQLIVNDGDSDSEPDTVMIGVAARGRFTLSVLRLVTSSSGTMTVSLDAPTGTSGLEVNLSLDNASLALVPETVTIAGGEQSADFVVTSDTVVGSATVTAFAPDYSHGAGMLTVDNRQWSLALADPVIGVGAERSTTGTLTLHDPAPAGGVTVSITSSDATIATASPLDAPTGVPPVATIGLEIPGGGTTAAFRVTGHVPGQAAFSAGAVGYTQASAEVRVTDSDFVLVPSNFTLAPGQILGYPIRLTRPAPAGGVTVTLANGDPSVATLPSSVLIPEGATAPASVPQITGGALSALNATSRITARAPGYARDNQSVTLRLSISFSRPNVAVTEGGTADIELNLSAPAPSGGLTINLSTDDPAKATVPQTAEFAPQATSIQVTVTGAGVGGTALRASGDGIAETTATVTVNSVPTISLDGATVGKDLQTTASGSLASPAPAGNVQITITSSDPAKVLLARNAGAPGAPGIAVQVDAGSSTIPAFYIQALAGAGAVQLTATAPGYAGATSTVTLLPSGFRIASPDSIDTTASSPNTAVTVGVVALNSETLTVNSDQQPLRAGVSVNVPVDTDDHTVGVMTTSPIAFSGGDLNISGTSFDPVGGGTTKVLVTQPAGFTAPAAGTQLPVTVTAPAISLGGTTVGKDLQAALSGTLGAPAPAGNLQVTIQPKTPEDRGKIRLSNFTNSLSDDFQGRVIVQVGAGSSGIPTFYVHALVGEGNAQIRVTAPGYTGQDAIITLVPSGFVLTLETHLSICLGCTRTINTTSLSGNTTLYVNPATLNPSTQKYSGVQPLRAGIGSVSVVVASGTTAVGTMTTSPVAIGANEFDKTTAFDPASAGVTTLSLQTPAGFSTPNNFQTMTANVTGPRILDFGNAQVGKDMQVRVSVSLEAPAPAGNLQVTITSADPSKVRLSPNSTTLGSETGTLTLTIPVGGSTASFFIQALDNTGSVQLTATAPDYTDNTGTVQLRPSGFVLFVTSSFGSLPSFTTTSLAANTSLTVVASRLDPTTLNHSSIQTLRAGISPVSVNVSSSNPGVGTITTSPLVINANENQKLTAFDPVSAGTSVLSIDTPAGFSTPGNFQAITANVIPPNVNLGAAQVGKDMQVQTTASLPAPAPTGGVPMTVTVSDSTRVRLSTSATVLGDETGELTFNIAAGGTSTGAFYVQALAGSGTIQYTASAPGYNSVTRTITLYPSGFLLAIDSGCFGCAGTTINTQTTSPNTNLIVVPAALEPGTLTYRSLGALRPGVGPVSVNVVSSAPEVGTITTSPLIFNTNEAQKLTAFDPITAGAASLSIQTPAGFSSPSNFQEITANVTLAGVSLSNQVVGNVRAGAARQRGPRRERRVRVAVERRADGPHHIPDSLVLFPPDDTASNLDPGDRAATGFPQFSHGSVKLTALFNDLSDIE